MKDSTDLPLISENSLSTLTRICINEIAIRNHSYIISMCIKNFEQSQIDIKVRAKENADQWKSSFDVNAIETMTTKMGNFKSFNVFINMLEDAINQKNSSVSIDLYTSDDLELIRKNQQDQNKISKTKSSNKRYLILIYNAEYDRICYPLSLRYCGKPDTVILVGQICQLATENELLKSRLGSDTNRCDLEEECSRLKKENDDYRQQLSLHDGKEKNLQVEYLRQMIRESKSALIKERTNLQKTKAVKDDHGKKFNNQIELLKTSERQLKLKVKNLTNQINLLKKNCSPCDSQNRSSSVDCSKSADQQRYRSTSGGKRLPSSTDSHVRFNPTAYMHDKNLKLQQIELQKKKETHQRLNSGRRHSAWDISDSSLKFNNNNNNRYTSNSRNNSHRKRTNNLNRHKSKDSIDSDIECVSSPIILHKAASNNSTKILLPEYSNYDQQNEKSTLRNLTNTGTMIDIDQRLKSLEKFIKQNIKH
ncbi:unnamed protein product [Rotaria sordida]|uniref:Uncharacterized protein n=1 Tax=Rotaria sordida TaxID=392033 RepID=A0A814PJU1_9BILA|nr:unnamed protein product [Rotaria sordida]